MAYPGVASEQLVSVTTDPLDLVTTVPIMEPEEFVTEDGLQVEQTRLVLTVETGGTTVSEEVLTTSVEDGIWMEPLPLDEVVLGQKG